MIERTLTISQARNLLRLLTERKQEHLLRLGEEIAGTDIGPEIAPENAQVTQRLLEILRDQAKDPNPRVKVRLFSPGEEVTIAKPADEGKTRVPSEHEILESRAQELAETLAADADAMSAVLDKLHEVLTVPDAERDLVMRPTVKKTLSEMESTLRAFRKSTHIALEEFLGNRNPFVLDLVREYGLDADSARHGLHVAAFAAELTAHLGEAHYLGKSPTDGRLRHELFHRELVEIFLGGFLHDAGVWGEQDPVGHESSGAGIVAQIPHVNGIAESMVDIVLFHSDLTGLAASPGIVRARRGRESNPSFSAHYHESLEAAREQITDEADSASLKLLRDVDLKRILPVAIAEHYVSQTEGPDSISPRATISAAVGAGDNELYTRFMVPLCNSGPEAVAPRRMLVSLAGHLPVGGPSRGNPMSLDGDIGVSVHNEGKQAPHVVRISRREPNGKLRGLSPVPPESREFADRSAPESYMHIPVGRTQGVSVTVVGIMDRKAYEENFLKYEQWVKQKG